MGSWKETKGSMGGDGWTDEHTQEPADHVSAQVSATHDRQVGGAQAGRDGTHASTHQ